MSVVTWLFAVVGRAVNGACAGVAVVFLIVVGTGAVALFSGGATRVPGVLLAWAGQDNGTRSLGLLPQGDGMLAVVAVSAVLRVALPGDSGRRQRDPSS
ncbi:MAG: hypothetical protein ACRYF3_12050 [Janthinobacterium lividum]